MLDQILEILELAVGLISLFAIGVAIGSPMLSDEFELVSVRELTRNSQGLLCVRRVIGREHHERQFWAGNRLGQKGWIAVIRSKRANYGWLAKSRPPENVILQKS
jgi:hypothetical protein